MRYSVEPRDRIYVKGYEFLSFAKNMDKKLIINMVKIFLIVLKNLQRMQLKLLQEKNQKIIDELRLVPEKDVYF